MTQDEYLDLGEDVDEDDSEDDEEEVSEGLDIGLSVNPINFEEALRFPGREDFQTALGF